MVYYLQRAADGVLFGSPAAPAYFGGVWDLGYERFADPSKTLYTVLQLDGGAAPIATNASMILSLKKQAAKASAKGDNYTATKLLLQASQLGAV